MCVCIEHCASTFHVFCVFFIYFLFFYSPQQQLLTRSSVNSALVHCSRVPQTSLFINFFIKNGSHSTIHTFKNYFTTVFSVLSFQFQQNKFYPNTASTCHTQTQLQPHKTQLQCWWSCVLCIFLKRSSKAQLQAAFLVVPAWWWGGRRVMMGRQTW